MNPTILSAIRSVARSAMFPSSAKIAITLLSITRRLRSRMDAGHVSRITDLAFCIPNIIDFISVVGLNSVFIFPLQPVFGGIAAIR